MNKILISIMLPVLISACTVVTATDSVITAQPYIGLQERQNRGELRELVGVDPVRTEWCAAFVNAILELDSIPNLNDIEHPYPLTARGFLTWGDRVERADIQRGDVVVFPRGRTGWQGHVGFYVGTRIVDGDEYWIILGGNQSNEVRYDLYRANRSLGIRRWPGQMPQRQVQLLDLSTLQVNPT
jgi:uncharacterized protein (TIGR02594 family)